ncbi:MAG: DNA repair exonuclease [Cyanobacteria bacterium P01_F01_bin.86]
MPRFLHIADIHLGFDRYNSPERTKDFYYALSDVIDRYAIAAAVDFVLIAGDLFEHRVIQPAILNQAQLCFQQLKAAGIPVLAIEGNHDNTPYGTSTSWLKYLSQWGLLQLLEPGNVADGEPFYAPWDGKQGGYVDLPCGVRVLGSSWYGAAAAQAIVQIAEAIQALPSGPEHTVLMFHHGLEDQIARYKGALRYDELLPLRKAGVDYLALGHIHKNYSVEDWIFNPGSLEANNIEEGKYDRGAYLVELTPSGIQASLQQDYQQRSIVRLQVRTRGEESETELTELAVSAVETAIAQGRLVPNDQPIVELRIEGTVGFERLSLDTRHLQQTLQAMSQALIFLLKYDVEEISFQSPTADEASREQIEENAFLDLLAGHRDYKKRAPELANALVDLKNRCLVGQDHEALYQYVEDILTASSDRQNSSS